MSERQEQIRDRIANLMGWDEKVGATRDTFEVVRSALGDDCLVVGVDLLEQIASAIEGLESELDAAHGMMEQLYSFVDDSLCDCYDEYNQRRSSPCERCMLLNQATAFLDAMDESMRKAKEQKP